MNAFTRAIFRIARLIAGRERADWIDAMAAEANAAGAHSTAWAAGCFWASIKDRVARDWWFLLAFLFLPLCALVWKAAVFFATSDLLVHRRISPGFAVSLWIASPLPIAVLLGLIRPKRSTYLIVAASYLLVEFAPLLLLWLASGISPLAFFSAPQVNWYKADPGVRLGPAAGLTCDLFVWLAGAWLGMRWRRPASPTSISD